MAHTTARFSGEHNTILTRAKPGPIIRGPPLLASSLLLLTRKQHAQRLALLHPPDEFGFESDYTNVFYLVVVTEKFAGRATELCTHFRQIVHLLYVQKAKEN